MRQKAADACQRHGSGAAELLNSLHLRARLRSGSSATELIRTRSDLIHDAARTFLRASPIYRMILTSGRYSTSRYDGRNGYHPIPSNALILEDLEERWCSPEKSRRRPARGLHEPRQSDRRIRFYSSDHRRSSSGDGSRRSERRGSGDQASLPRYGLFLH